MPGDYLPALSDNPSTVARLLSRRRVSAAVGAVAVLFCAVMPLTDFGERAELRTHDLRFDLRHGFPRQTNAKIVLVTAEPSTLAAWQEPTLFWGARYAKVIEVARKHGATVVGIDTVLATSADDALIEGGADGSFAPDETLARAIEDAGGSVVLAFALGGAEEERIVPHPRFSLIPGMENRLGFIDLEPSADFVIRRATSAVRGKNDGQSVTAPSFAAVLAETAQPGSGHLNDSAPFYINYTGEPFPKIAAERVAADTLTKTERESLRGASVIIAKNYAHSLDKHIASGGRITGGAEIQAQAAATLLDDCRLTRLPVAAESTIALLVGAGIGAVAWASKSARRGLWIAAGMLSCFLLAAMAGFLRGDVLLPVAAPALACALPWLLVRAARSIEEAFARSESEAARLRIEATFGRHVSPGVRDYLLRSPDNLRLGGKQFDATIVFFDIRGSTRYAEGREPGDVVREFNALYTVVIAAIEAHGGMINRFLGDGFLAVWGWPRDLPGGHAQAAVGGCLAVLDAVARFNAKRETAGEPAWRVGLAAHSGSVLGGNVGVESRTEFTFMGDTVNVAAHMEKFNKEFGTQLVISDATRQRLADSPTFLPAPGFLPGRTMAVWGVDAAPSTKEKTP